jgi:hypothetical protein
VNIVYSVLVIRPENFQDIEDHDPYEYMIIRSFDDGRTWHNVCKMAYNDRDAAYSFAHMLNSQNYDNAHLIDEVDEINYSHIDDGDDGYKEYSSIGPVSSQNNYGPINSNVQYKYCVNKKYWDDIHDD